jgi:restriction endonuclease S subunit
MKLSDIARLQSGLVLTRKEAHSPAETVKTYERLNLRSLSSYNEINHKELDIFPARDILDKTVLTQPGDIVIKLFTPIFPVVITEHDAGLVIPSQLAVIRIFNNDILPQFLRYWLSTPAVSDSLQLLEGWQSQRTIKIGTFAELEIPVLPLKKQQIIADMVSTNLHREQLYKSLIDEENKFTMLNIQRIIGGKR